MKYYQGIYKPKNPEKYRGNASNIVYRSGWEKACFVWCDKNPNIVEWSSEEIVIPYLYEVDRKYHRYFVDLKIKTKGGDIILIEIKPKKETEPPKGSKKTKRYVTEGLNYVKNMNKWEAAEKYAKKKGWKFQIWTEETLQKMGILKTVGKVPGKLKPLRRPKKKPKKRAK